MFTTRVITVILFLIFNPLLVSLTLATKRHIINFRSPSLYPEGMAWDPSLERFIVGSLRHGTIHSVSDAGAIENLISDPSLPLNASIGGLAVDSRNHHLLVVVHSIAPLPPFNALAAYDLRTRRRIFLSLLPDDDDGPAAVANDVSADFRGNAYVTNSAGNFIWKVTVDGKASIFSRSPLFKEYPLAVAKHVFGSECGLNGIAYVSEGYLLVLQSNTGKMFKVNTENGSSELVMLTDNLTLADDIVVRKDGVVLVVSQHNLWFIKSSDRWAEGVVFDKTGLEVEGFATSVAVRGDERAYVLYGHVMEGIIGNLKEGREWFRIEEVRPERDSKEENVWVLVLIGLGLAYFLFWRFQMKQLVTNMDKKAN